MRVDLKQTSVPVQLAPIQSSSDQSSHQARHHQKHRCGCSNGKNGVPTYLTLLRERDGGGESGVKSQSRLLINKFGGKKLTCFLTDERRGALKPSQQHIKYSWLLSSVKYEVRGKGKLSRMLQLWAEDSVLMCPVGRHIWTIAVET